MRSIADRYGFPLPRVVAAFVALSPNNGYLGNLRSLVSVLDGVRRKLPVSRITVSTYGHCRDRACAYVTGSVNFLERAKGLKIGNFYHNVMAPADTRWVTVDGHVVAAWRADDGMVMKEAIPTVREYREIKAAIQRLAFRELLIPNQYQAMIWFARKRILNVRYDPQGSLFHASDDAWQVLPSVDDILPFAMTGATLHGPET